ncbi:MAG TPA: glycoside hydrolase family 15 protein [Alphaproteobacteria bacterium]|nr:glycoside hydrolase family 15 protein [Alphaproteobacteria bacterium]
MITYANATINLAQSDFTEIAQHMYALMLRNIATDGFVFNDPVTPGNLSLPGCVLAAPSFPQNTPGVDQDYVFNWVRDAAITAMELVAADPPALPGGGVQQLIDYVNFANTCYNNAVPTADNPGVTKGHACFTISGAPRPWTEQSDGPALQTVAILLGFDLLDAPTQGVAENLIANNLTYLLAQYQSQTTNLWEEHTGYSFFARAAQLRCFQMVQANTLGIAVPAGVNGAIAWLQNALSQHWNGQYYVSILPPPVPFYDPNIDIVCAAIYGAIAVTDTKLLATAALLRSQWSDAASPELYPINTADAAQGLGPLMGRYPGDVYDGDMGDASLGDHPWALCTCNFAELYYTLANEIDKANAVPYDALSAPFFAQVGVNNGTASAATVSAALRNAGDAMLGAVIYHSDHLELSEQFDGTTGYEKSVRNLTWSYASLLSAVRAKTGQHVEG